MQARIAREAKAREDLGGPLALLQDAWADLWGDQPLAGQAANLALGGGNLAFSGYLTKKLATKGVENLGAGAKSLGAVAEASEPVFAYGSQATSVAQAELSAAQTFGKTALSYGSKGLASRAISWLPAIGQAYELAKFQYQAIDSLGTDSDFAQERRGQVRSAAAQEIAGRIARGAASGQYQDIYQAAPEIARLARGAGVGKEGGVEATLREVVRLLAESRQEGVPAEFQTSVKNAMKDALRESGATITTGENPSRAKTAKAEAGGEGRT